MGLLDQFSGMSDDQDMGLLSAGLGMLAAGTRQHEEEAAKQAGKLRVKGEP